MIVTWSTAFVVLGLVFGQFSKSVPDLLANDVGLANFVAAGALTPADVTGEFLSTVLGLIGIIASVPGVQVMLRTRSEEVHGRSEPVLAEPVSRPQYFGSNVLIAFATSGAVLLIAGVLVAAIASAGTLEATFSDAFLQALATVPAVWAVVALSAAVVGARPRVPLAAWAGVVLSFVLTFLGPTFNLWDWIVGISPFWHVPNVTESVPDWSGLWWLGLATALLTALGFAGYQRRDIART